MAKRQKKSTKNDDGQISAHQKLMQKKRGRDRMVTGLIGFVILACIGGLAWFFLNTENMEEDYSVVGLGDPVIVQVHQLNCGDCDILQANARSALKEIDDERLKYRVAYLHKSEGIAFASKHGAAQQTTLVLFDQFGRKKGIYRGVQETDELVTLFTDLL